MPLPAPPLLPLLLLLPLLALLPYLARELRKWRVRAARLRAAARLPGPPAEHWLLGNLPALLRDPGRTFLRFQEWDRQYGQSGVFKFRVMWHVAIVVTDPELFLPLLRAGPQYLPKLEYFYQRLDQIVHPPRPSVLTRQEDELWRLVRKGVFEAFQPANLKLVFSPMVDTVAAFMDALHARAGAPLDASDFNQRITLDILCRFGFNWDCGASRLDTPCELLELSRGQLAGVQTMNNPLNRWIPWREVPRGMRRRGLRLRGMITELLDCMEAEPPPPHTLAAHILAIRDAADRPLTRDDVIAELGILWGAGFDTSAHTLTWALFLISTHPSVEAGILDELGDLAASSSNPTPRRLEWGDVPRLRRLGAAVQEAMRLYPAVAGGTLRAAARGARAGGAALPEGTAVLVPSWAVQRSARLWDRPDEFLPFERWLPRGGGGGGGEGEGGGGKGEGEGEGGGGGGGGGCEEAGGGGVCGEAGGGGGGCAETKGGGEASGGAGGGGRPPMSAPSAFLAWGQGARSCAGQGLAALQLRVALALLLGSFSFDLAPGWTAEDVAASAALAVTLRPEGGLWVVPRRRANLPGGRRAGAPAG